jgi:hypothetical protein
MTKDYRKRKEYEFVDYFKNLLWAKLKLRELGEPCENGNTEPSHNFVEGVTTRDEINFSTSAGQPL